VRSIDVTREASPVGSTQGRAHRNGRRSIRTPQPQFTKPKPNHANRPAPASGDVPHQPIAPFRLTWSAPGFQYEGPAPEKNMPAERTDPPPSPVSEAPTTERRQGGQVAIMPDFDLAKRGQEFPGPSQNGAHRWSTHQGTRDSQAATRHSPALLTAERKGSHPGSRRPPRKPAAGNSPGLVSCARGSKR